MKERFIHGYRATVDHSIYTNRFDKIDIRVQSESSWGAKHGNGRLYATVQVLAAEDFSTLRTYSPVPERILSEILEYARSVIPQLAEAAAL